MAQKLEQIGRSRRWIIGSARGARHLKRTMARARRRLARTNPENAPTKVGYKGTWS